MDQFRPDTKYVWVRSELEGGDVPFIQTDSDGNFKPFERALWLASDVNGEPGEWTKKSITLGTLYPYRQTWRGRIADGWHRFRLWLLRFVT